MEKCGTILCVARVPGTDIDLAVIIDPEAQNKLSGTIPLIYRSTYCVSRLISPQESFFGHMKDEYDLSGCATFGEAESCGLDKLLQYRMTE